MHVCGDVCLPGMRALVFTSWFANKQHGYKQNSLRVDDLKGDKRVNCVFIISAVALLVHAIV